MKLKEIEILPGSGSSRDVNTDPDTDMRNMGRVDISCSKQ